MSIVAAPAAPQNPLCPFDRDISDGPAGEHYRATVDGVVLQGISRMTAVGPEFADGVEQKLLGLGMVEAALIRSQKNNLYVLQGNRLSIGERRPRPGDVIDFATRDGREDPGFYTVEAVYRHKQAAQNLGAKKHDVPHAIADYSVDRIDEARVEISKGLTRVHQVSKACFNLKTLALGGLEGALLLGNGFLIDTLHSGTFNAVVDNPVVVGAVGAITWMTYGGLGVAAGARVVTGSLVGAAKSAAESRSRKFWGERDKADAEAFGFGVRTANRPSNV
jgi:hypothetical protein